MALNYPRLDNASGVWNMKEVTEAVLGGYWPNAGARGVFAGGGDPSDSNIIEYVTLATTGDATDFGDLTAARTSIGNSASSFTRGIWSGGMQPSAVNTIEYITIMSAGNAADFGDLSAAIRDSAALSNSVRGLNGGGVSPTNVINYFQIAATGNSTDFGDLTVARYYMGATASPTRGVWAGGETPNQNTIDYVTIATTGNATDFGDLTGTKKGNKGASSSTRGVFCGGATSPSSGYTDDLDYITLASTGNAIDYGNLSGVNQGGGATSNSVRGIYGGGKPGDPSGNEIVTIDYFSIPNGGTAIDFGDLTDARHSLGSLSNSHGGLNDGYQGTRINPIPQGSGAGTRGLWAGGQTPSTLSSIDLVTITTLGNASDFGDLTLGRYGAMDGAMTSSVRACFAGGGTPAGYFDTIDYVHFAHTGNAADFGNLTSIRAEFGSGSNETRGITYAGYASPAVGPSVMQNTIDYITIATVGNASDFGDASTTAGGTSCVNSTTRLAAYLGYAGEAPGSISNVIEYLTIGSTGNATDFGDKNVTRNYSAGGISSTTRGCVAGGETPSDSNVIDYITIGSTGNATDFGDLSAAGYKKSGLSSTIRGLIGGGFSPAINDIEYITIASTGDAADFGDLTTVNYGPFSASNGHGGLS